MQDKRALNPALGYNRFSEIIRNAEANTLAEAPEIGGYGRAVVGRRLLQRILEVSLNPFIEDCAKRHRHAAAALPAANENFNCGGLHFSGGSKRITITASLWFRSLIEFGVQWIRILVVMAKAVIKGPAGTRGKDKVTLLFGAGIDDIIAFGSDVRFIEFCKKGPVIPLRDARRMIVECVKETSSSNPDYCSYAKYPLFRLASELPFTGRQWVSFAASHIVAAIRFLKASLHRPLVAILARDVAFHALIHALNRAELIDSVIITNSHYHVQPLWMRSLPGRKFTTHMAWYSQNSIPFTYRFDGVRSCLPNHRHIEVDNIWVWTTGFGNYLREQGAAGEIQVVGPILWHLPQPESGAKTHAGAIVVFDVTPFNQEFIERFGLPYNYYHARNVQSFIKDIIAARGYITARTGKVAPICIKHKRSFSPQHDRGYLDFIEDANRNGMIEVAPTQTNLYTLISGAKVVVVMPYSSPAYVAAELGVPTIYFDPSGELVPTYEPTPGITFVAGREALQRALTAVLIEG